MFDTRLLSLHNVSTRYWSWFQTDYAVKTFAATHLADKTFQWTSHRELFEYIRRSDVIQAFKEMFSHTFDAAVAKSTLMQQNTEHVTVRHNIRILLAAYPTTFFPSIVFEGIDDIEAPVLHEATNMLKLLDIFTRHWIEHESFMHIHVELCEELVKVVTKYLNVFYAWKNPNSPEFILTTLMLSLTKLQEEQQNPGAFYDIAYVRMMVRSRILPKFENAFTPEERHVLIQEILARGLPNPYTI